MLKAINGRVAVLSAVLLQAAGKVSYGTWLGAVPSTLFVLISFTIAAVMFTVISGRTTGQRAFGWVLLLNASTAITFLAFFQALKLIEPAIVAAIEIGIAPPLALLIGYIIHSSRPNRTQGIVCTGILVGCLTLAIAAQTGSGLNGSGQHASLGIAASLIAGAGAVAITVASKALMGRGWSRGAVLAHRFYLIIPVAFGFTLYTPIDPVVRTFPIIGIIVAVAVLGVALPLYLLQIGIERSDAYTVLSTMAALPVFTFILEAFSSAYRLSWLTAAGITVITATLLFGVRESKRENH